MKQAKALLPLLKDRVLQQILEEIIAEQERILSLPMVSQTDTVSLRNALNRIMGKI